MLWSGRVFINEAVDVLNQDPNNCYLSEDIIVAIILKGLPKEHDSQCSILADTP